MVLSAVPITVAVILFTFSSGLAARYERKLAAAEEELRHVKETATSTEAPIEAIPTPGPLIDFAPELKPLEQRRDRIVQELNQALVEAGRLKQELLSANQRIGANLEQATAAHRRIIEADDRHNKEIGTLNTYIFKYTQTSRDFPREYNLFTVLSDLKRRFIESESDHFEIRELDDKYRESPGKIVTSFRAGLSTEINNASSQQKEIASKLDQLAVILPTIERKEKDLAEANQRIVALYASHISSR